MGVGVGCGIGWGPGFGPEAIGYVGAGCGIGFSVGFTLAGLGVGFPVNFLFQVPYNATMATRDAALKLVGLSSLLSKKHFAGNGWPGIAPHISEPERKASERFSSFEQQHLSVKGTDFFEMKNSLPVLATSACESVRALNTQLFSSQRGIRENSDPTLIQLGYDSIVEGLDSQSSMTKQRTFCQEAPASKKPSLYYNALKKEKRVYKFLIGLNPIFEKIRNHILSLDTLPTLEEAFFEVKREESGNKLTPNTYTAYDVLESSALVAKGAHSNGYKLKNSQTSGNDIGAVLVDQTQEKMNSYTKL
ncbi:hypothetical protein K1719_034190 [Acacia pycnantha]|nr:hypothetical protein K1719_034190 [Acacia pycnantha]